MKVIAKIENMQGTDSAIFAMVFTASTGYFPAALSPESIIAVVPS